MVEASQIKIYPFKIVAHEVLTTSAGKYDTVVLEHLSLNQERLTKVWLAKDLDYIVVKLQQNVKGKKAAEGTLKSFTTSLSTK